jgi:hypothetical protein
VQIRLAAVELVSTRKDLAARKLLVEAAKKDDSEEVTELACQQLAAAGDVQAFKALLELIGSGKGFRSRAAVDALSNVTRQNRYTKAEWNYWWKRSKNSFPQGPTK